MGRWFLDGVLISMDELQAPSPETGGYPQHGEVGPAHPHWPGHRMAPETTAEPSATHGIYPGHRRAVEQAERAGAERIERGGAGRPPQAGTTDTDAAIRRAAQEAGIDVNTMRAIASIESGMNPESNRGRRSQYKGLFQLGHEEWARWGRGDIYDAGDNAAAAGRMLASHKADFKQRFGRDPTDAELYMIHQQGMGFHTRGAMTNIAGNRYPGMRGPQTPESFQRGWGAELERRRAHFERGTAAPPAERFEPGARGGPQDATGSANFMHGQYGAPGQNLATVQTSAGPLMLNRASAPAFTGFIEELHGQGAPLGRLDPGSSYAHRNIAGSRQISQHAYGNAVDLGNQSARNVVSPAFRHWVESHPAEWRAALNRWNMVSGGDWRNPDLGHVEWAGPRASDRMPAAAVPPDMGEV